MNQFIDKAQFQKPSSSKSPSNWSVSNVFVSLSLLTYLSFGCASCSNEDKKTAEASHTATEIPPTADKTASTTTTTTAVTSSATTDNVKNPNDLKMAGAPQSPLHKFLDSLNVAKQPQWKLTYLDSVARVNKNITIPQLKHILDSLGHVKRGFIQK